MLSKRVLYFVDDKIFFHCPYKTVFEGCREPLRWQPDGYLLRMEKPLQNYQDLITLYSNRVLSKDDDAFRAISGILGRISGIQQWQIIAGMPTIALEHMMLFERRYHILYRRQGFPSYSWLGWKGALQFTEGVHILSEWIVWYVWNPASDTLSIGHRPASPRVNTKSIERLTTNDVISQSESDFGLLLGMDLSQKSPSTGDHVRPPRSFPLLCFWTLAVFFDLYSVDYVKGTAFIGSTFLSYNFGKVILDAPDDYPLFHSCEFILLSRIHQNGAKKYTVMLIDWTDGVAERRGIGEIVHSEIRNSLAPGPIWKEIVLG